MRGARPALCLPHRRRLSRRGGGHARICRPGPAQVPPFPPRLHVRAMCGAHGRAGGGRGSIPDEWLIGQVVLIACSERREAAACAASPGLGDGAASTVCVPPSASFFRCKFGKLLTKLFGLNRDPTRATGGEDFAGPLCFKALALLCGPQPKDFYGSSAMHPSAGNRSVPPAVH